MYSCNTLFGKNMGLQILEEQTLESNTFLIELSRGKNSKGGDNGLYIILIPNVLIACYLIRCPKLFVMIS